MWLNPETEHVPTDPAILARQPAGKNRPPCRRADVLADNKAIAGAFRDPTEGFC
jgi:hypothetical protein